MAACLIAVMKIGLIQIVYINELTDEKCRKEQSIGYAPRMRSFLDSVRYRNVTRTRSCNLCVMAEKCELTQYACY